MKPLMLFSVVLIAFGLIIGCNERASSPTDVSFENAEIESNLSDNTDMKTIAKGHAGLHGDKVGEFEIMLENLTPANSQPFSPPIAATHKHAHAIFRNGAYASDELRQVAEDAVNDPMINFLSNSHRVYDVAVGGGALPPGQTATMTIEARVGFRKLSLVAMLVNTNDAFVAADGVLLPINGSKEYYLHSYDAGTEKNTELEAHIPGPCCGNPFVRVPTHEKISRHDGIQGIGDLDPAIYDWDEPVAKLTITRVD
ncbi:hypothetical protein GF337_00040 [candidate division KSB1 bacterium]|nr:hypothetical protein [candidate division KSB1 bacterium]